MRGCRLESRQGMQLFGDGMLDKQGRFGLEVQLGPSMTQMHRE